MYIFHSTIDVAPGYEDELEKSYNPGAHPILKAPGFLRRMKLKDKEHPGRYFYISVWESLADLENYRSTEEVRKHVEKLSALNVLKIDRVECELVGGVLE